MNKLLIISITVWLVAGCATVATPDRAVGERFTDCDDCPEMVVIGPGTFLMGFEGGEPERYEGPVRQITIDYAFALGRTEITVAQYRDFVTATGYEAAPGCFLWDGVTARMRDESTWLDPGYDRELTDSEPVVCVDFTDVSAYVDWLAEKTGEPYRLPSEAEWEYAADAGSTATYPWGERPEDACIYANVFDRSAAAKIDSPLQGLGCNDEAASVTAVGSYAPNAFGLHDMVGNVWEWTQDCYQMPAPAGPLDGSPVTEGECGRRSVKGGSWITGISRQRPTFRGRDPEDRASLVFGFRVARDF